MLPTIDTQLAAVRTSLAAIAEQVGGDAAAELTAVGRAVRIIERTWRRRLPVLVADIADLGELLDELAPGQAPPWQFEHAGGGPTVPDLGVVEASHEALRSLLAQLIVDAGDDEAGRSLRRRATACLRASAGRQAW